jgi:hypothetical protein
MVVLRINFKYRGSETEFPRAVSRSLDDGSPVKPDLVILRILLRKGIQVVQLIRKISLQMSEDLSSILPLEEVKTVGRG